MRHRCHEGERNGSVGGAARRSGGFACTCLPALVGCAAVAACALENRPAWERAAVGSPPSYASLVRPYPPQARTALQQDQAKAAASAQTRKTAGGRVVLPTATKPLGQAVSPSPSTATGKAAAGKAVPTLASTPEPPRAADPAWAGVETHVARHEDTLLDLAVGHNLGFIEVAMANPGVDPWLPGEGTPIVLPTLHLPPDAPPRGIVLNLPEQRLYHYEGGGFDPILSASAATGTRPRSATRPSCASRKIRPGIRRRRRGTTTRRCRRRSRPARTIRSGTGRCTSAGGTI